MPFPLFTASRLDTIFRCPGAATLPHVEERERNISLAQAGTSEHASLLDSDRLPPNLSQWLNPDNDFFVAPVFERSHTVDFSTDPPTVGISADYAVFTPTTSGGTPDAFTVRSTPAGLVLRLPDLKTGVGHAQGTLPPPQDSWQLRYYALAVLLSQGWPASNTLASCTVAWWIRDFEAERHSQPDLEPEEREHLWQVREAQLSEGILLESIDRLRELTFVLSSTSIQPIWREGVWCENCSAFRACPVQRSPVDRLGIALGAAMETSTEVTEQHAAAVAEALPSMRALVEQSERFLDRFIASQGPIHIQSGVLLTRERIVRKHITDGALSILAEEYPDHHRLMVRESTSLSRIAQALGEAVPGKRTAEVLQLLKTRGAVEEIPSFRLRLRKDMTE